jgi:hypothetical protein
MLRAQLDVLKHYVKHMGAKQMKKYYEYIGIAIGIIAFLILGVSVMASPSEPYEQTTIMVCYVLLTYYLCLKKE